MDNICHTLVGAALGEAGLKRRTRLGNATLMIAANLPDIDVLVFASNTPSVAFRRGWTHGVLAQVVLPVILTGIMFGLAHLRRRPREDAPVSVPWLFALSVIGIYSHVFLDYLNNYGVRLLAPIDWRWFYGDTLFIIDPWLLLILGAGVWLARRNGTPRAAGGAVIFATCYVVIMLLSARTARSTVVDVWRETRGQVPQALMVGPVPITPIRRDIVVDAGDHYETGSFSWWSGAVTFDPTPVPKNDQGPIVAAAARDRGIRAFLVWSRFPYWDLQRVADGTRVTVRDMRFGGAIGSRFAMTTIVRD